MKRNINETLRRAYTRYFEGSPRALAGAVCTVFVAAMATITIYCVAVNEVGTLPSEGNPEEIAALMAELQAKDHGSKWAVNPAAQTEEGEGNDERN